MDFGLSQEQQMLAESVTRLLRELCPLDEVRHVAEGASAVSAQTQAALAEMGLPGLVVPEALGSLCIGMLHAAVAAAALGEPVDRKSVVLGTRGSVRSVFGVRRLIKI